MPIDPRPVVVLGAAGFIGLALSEHLAARGFAVRTVTHRATTFAGPVENCVAGILGPDTDWRALLTGARAVVHLASRAHSPSPADVAWTANECATATAIAAAAAAVGLERTILLSSIKVLGETAADRPFSASSVPNPRDEYGRAKHAIEQAMQRTDAPGLVVIRSPLVYGPGVKGNFRSLLRLVARGLPLPFAAIRNRRAFVFRDSLLALIETALVHPAAPGGTFLLRDDTEIGTPQLVREIATRLGQTARLFAVPPGLLRAAAAAIGRGDAIQRLTGSLTIDDGATRTSLDWHPTVSLAAGLDATCRWFAKTVDAYSTGSYKIGQ